MHRYLAANLGHERFAAADRGMYPGADSAAKLRSLTGEAFFDSRFAQTVQGLPGELFSTTLLRLPATQEMVESPFLDRLAVRYFVTAPWGEIFGASGSTPGDGSTVTLEPGRPASVPLKVNGPIRGVGITWPGVVLERTRIDVSIRDARGTELAKTSRVALPEAGTPIDIAVAGEGIPAGTPLTAVFTVATAAPVVVAADGGRPAVSTVTPEDDGLRLAYAGNSTVWERTTALPRIRWASEVVRRFRPVVADVRADRQRAAAATRWCWTAAAGAAPAGRPATVDRDRGRHRRHRGPGRRTGRRLPGRRRRASRTAG